MLADGFPAGFQEKLHEGFSPVLSITEETEITERLLGRSELSLTLAELVAEGDEKTAVPAALVLREG